MAKRIVRRETLIAIAFASGILNSSQPAVCGNQTESKNSLIRKIINRSDWSADLQAFILVSLAQRYCSGMNRDRVEAQFVSIAEGRERFMMLRRLNNNVVYLANQTAAERRASTRKPQNSNSIKIPSENIALANEALQKALPLLEKSSDKFLQLNLYFIASNLFHQVGNTEGMQNCESVIKSAISSATMSKPVGDDYYHGLVSILDSEAFSIIPLQVPDTKDAPQKIEVKSFTEAEFIECEKLKLKGLSLIDRLGIGNHFRRKAHRDLALWYMYLGKNDLAEAQKQILFKLIGTSDDKLLYPQYGGCAHLVWWQVKVQEAAYDCGMG